MGLVRLKVKELAAEKGWTLKEVSERSGVIYSTVRHYARIGAITKVDYVSVLKLARTFEIAIEDLVEVIED